MDKYKNAINYVIKLVKSLDSTVEVEVVQPRPYQYSFYIDIKGKRLEVTFNRSMMGDFEYEITKDKGTDKYYASEGFIKFKVFIALGQAGVIPGLRISDELLNVKRDWLRDSRTQLSHKAWLHGFSKVVKVGAVGFLLLSKRCKCL